MNTLGIKKHKLLHSMGTKINSSMQSMGTKLSPISPISPFMPVNNFKNGIQNDSNGTEQAREVIKGIYNDPKPHNNSMEKHRKHKRTNFN